MSNPRHLAILKSLATKSDSKIVFLVMDGIGGIRTTTHGTTELEAASTPNLDRLAQRASLGRIIPALRGMTVGSGPGHLALFGYDPVAEENEIGRGVLEAVGVDYALKPHEVAARGNFATLDAAGLISDRRAGRIGSDEGTRVCAKMQAAVAEPIDGVSVKVLPVKEYRFCVVFDGPDLEGAFLDTDPQVTGKAPLPVRPSVEGPHTERTRKVIEAAIAKMSAAIKDEPKANGFSLRGFAKDPGIETLQQRWGMRCGAIATHPLYRGVARLVGMDILKTGTEIADEFETLKQHWNEYDFFFLHVKKTDSYGEDGNRRGKISIIEETDRHLAWLGEKLNDVIVVTGDHCTPPPMRGHSFHPVPTMIAAKTSDVGGNLRFCERTCVTGSLGLFPSMELMQLALGHAGKLQKFGA
ncbi:MAG: 2,3-bisphosphoglycerate-independent phosphoglycerate mutase [Candidatus Sumerlaeia bacterium]|nr:2,3-bisphosphoglycerate-independent phosphoglycerate mutase [Candidatus Sumerlaeia bacterium]